MATKVSGSIEPRIIYDDFKKLFGKKVFVAGEDAALYDVLFSRLATSTNPSDFVEWLYLRDITEFTWQIERIRRCQAAILNNARLDAVARLLKPIVAGDTPEFAVDARAKELAVKYWSDNPKEKQEVVSLLAKHGLIEVNISAEAFAQTLPTLEISEKILWGLEGRREKALNEIERRRDAFAQRMREAVNVEIKDLSSPIEGARPETHGRTRKRLTVTSDT